MRLKRVMTGLVAMLAAATVATTLTAAGDARPPRIVAAVMQDADGDGHADRVGLMYSERVRHAADRDGTYPFLVAGYKIRAVGAASGNTVVLTLVEKAGIDAAARPAVRYGRTKADSIVDRARNEAVAQVFRATRAHGNRPRAIPPPLPPPNPAPGDRDGDGVVDTQDCAPADPKIRPGAPDAPDTRLRRFELRRHRRRREASRLRVTTWQGHEPGHEGGAKARDRGSRRHGRHRGQGRLRGDW